MSTPVDMVRIVRELRNRPRGRACIVFTDEYENQKKWAAKLAGLTGSCHLDLLELFAQDAKLSSKIRQFLIPVFFQFLKERGKNSVLVISGLEFIKATWANQANVAEQFSSHVETWNQTPGLVFVLQYDNLMARYRYRRHPQHTFVIEQKETLAL